MSYQALYRVWRPQKFNDLIGQGIITKTLKNALITNQISHAYLFAGPRGTGKTSAAKIFAKAINCPNQQDGEPCNDCFICKSITEGNLNDVIEIDAASNNGVEEIRNIRDKAKYAPTESKYKVYIIDEVHMLSTGAFNALLKTLEEPPEHVIFILATTEPQKIPATIISRVQRFDFKRIKASDILNRMEYILNEKHLSYDDKALKLIAKSAEGGMRDALSILDQALSFGMNKVTYENALEVTGSVDKKLINQYLNQVVADDIKSALLSVRELVENGKDANRFIEDILDYCQNILLYKQVPEMLKSIELDILDNNFEDTAKSINSDMLYKMIIELNNVQNQMRFSSHPDIYLEVLTVKLASIGQTKHLSSDNSQSDESINDLLSKIKHLQQEIDRLKSNKSKQFSTSKVISEDSQVTEKSNKINTKPAKFKVNLNDVYAVLDNATRKDLNNLNDAWTELLQSLDVTQRAVMHVSKPVAASPEGSVIAFEYAFLCQRANSDSSLLDALENGLDRIVGYVPKMIFVPKDEWPKIRSNYIKQNKSNQSEMIKDNQPAETQSTLVDKAAKMFGKDILNIKED
ncbi:DNA polymerase III subunit gamma/tau [Apilactobacillus xinyiensis]|uniref:DNA polymerase III subunit gamma/tau n=1 Tax=Apilactobacillus xinyiensis TaxID=2841032 RepID=UPI001C7D0840|nr:DNA polymerase III subunit gamma/tau [Apilactobacillus xinyiensis]